MGEDGDDVVFEVFELDLVVISLELGFVIFSLELGLVVFSFELGLGGTHDTKALNSIFE